MSDDFESIVSKMTPAQKEAFMRSLPQVAQGIIEQDKKAQQAQSNAALIARVKVWQKNPLKYKAELEAAYKELGW